MQIRSNERWRQLFAEHAASGLSAQQFCWDKKLCAKYFSLRKKQLGWQESVSPFVRAQLNKPVARQGVGTELVRDGQWLYDPISGTWMWDPTEFYGWALLKGVRWGFGKALGLGFAGARLIGMVLDLEDDTGGRSPGAQENKKANCQCE